MTSPAFRKNFLAIITALLLFAGFNAALLIPLQPVGTPLTDWMVTFNGVKRPAVMPFSETLNPGVNTMVLTTIFSSSDGDTLILPRINGNAVDVKLNGETVYRIGAMREPTANLWNSHLTIPLPLPLLPENELKVTIASSVVSIGMAAIPMVAPYSIAVQHSSILQWIFPNLILITTGMVGILGFVLLLFCVVRKEYFGSEFFIGLSLLLCAVFNQDMTFRETTGSLTDFLWFEKFVVGSGYMAAAFLISGVEFRVHSKNIIRRWAIVCSGVICIVLFLTPDLYWLNSISGYLSFVQFAIMIALCVLIFVSRNTSRLLLTAITFISLSILQMGISVLFQIPNPIFIPYTISLTAIAFGVEMVLDFNFLIHENQNLKTISKLDPLTKVLNRRGVNLINTNHIQFIVMVDLDDFKNLNDQYGHAMGDECLIRFAGIARENLRQDDLVIRYGGDEFLLAFTSIPRDENGSLVVEKILERILKQYSSSVSGMDFTFSYGIAAVEQSFDRSLKVADARMYDMKNRKKKSELMARLEM
jgi:diguanylate cyclase (GGDEF)-like protein